ncbi:MAG: methyl-accepting chemotaxis protein, partial [Fusobacteria bacterium]|nr:methyl-accepting chemotaxis protein [Fusobacteriota bacterium]
RNLAQRSSDAAKETADMINESISKTDRGVEISGVVMQSLQAINGDINKLDDLMEEILTASEDQTNGIVLVNKSLNNMGEIIQGAAGNAEQTAAAAEELDAQSESMRDIVRELVEMIDGKNK